MTVTCPRQCGSEGFENPGALAAHLIDAHDMAGSAALATAREVAGLSRAYRPPKPVLPNVSTTKEAPMTCKICGGDHRSDNKICPKHGGTKDRSEEHTSELQSRLHLVCRLLLEKKN